LVAAALNRLAVRAFKALGPRMASGSVLRMRTLLALALCGAVTAPGAALAQASAPRAAGEFAARPASLSHPATPLSANLNMSAALNRLSGRAAGYLSMAPTPADGADRAKGSNAPRVAPGQAALSAEDVGKPALAEPATAPALIPAGDRVPPGQPSADPDRP
jgi:hypothetical protein